MITHSSILAWRTSMDRGACRLTIHGVIESDRTEQLSTSQLSIDIPVVRTLSLPSCSLPGCPFPIWSLALSACVSSQTIHF